MNNNDNDEEIISIKTKNSIDDYYAFINAVDYKFINNQLLEKNYLKEIVGKVPSLKKAELNFIDDFNDYNFTNIISNNNIHVVDIRSFEKLKDLGILKRPTVINISIVEKKFIPDDEDLKKILFKENDMNKFKILTFDNKQYIIIVNDFNDLFTIEVALSYLFNHVTEDLSLKVLDILNSNIGGTDFQYNVKPLLMQSIKNIDTATVARYEQQEIFPKK